MKDLSAIKGRYYIARLIEEGEHEHQDFKFAISDARKIARSISAFANNDGGRLLVGVKDNGTIAGIRNEEDIYMIETAASTYCRPEVAVDFKAYRTDPGTVVIQADIPRYEKRPVYVRETDGQLKAYFRVKDENIVAPDLMIEAWRYESDSERQPLTFSEQHQSIINYVRNNGRVFVEEIWKNLHISSEVTRRHVAQMAGSGLLKLTLSEGQLYISVVE